MPNRVSQSVLAVLIEKLADIEHQRWSHWQRFMHGKCERKPDGSLGVPPEFVEKWENQMGAPYADLSESEKESDREQVRKYLPLILHELGIEVDAFS
jgi:hypothetical protein